MTKSVATAVNVPRTLLKVIVVVTTHPVSPVNQVGGLHLKVRFLLAGISALNDVVGDLAASVVLRGVPCQVAGICFDV